ncbi:MAG: hypothetical protein M3511_01320 [Deinococcota bacterium]|jgi:hypothetical protein|nr:hypothetical protein [Deinococcota bacterium]
MADETATGIIFDGSYEELIGGAAAPEAKLEAAGAELEEAGIQLEGVASHTFTLARIEKWPETKTDWEVRKIAFGVKTKVPIVRFRECELKLQAVVSHPELGNFLNIVEDCIRESVAAGVVASVISGGNLAAGATALQTYLYACLSQRGISQAQKLNVKLERNKTCGGWG